MQTLPKVSSWRKHVRLLTIMPLTFIVSCLAVGLGASKSNLEEANRPAIQVQQTANIIDGALNPELIPDNVAYSLMFRFI